MKDSLRQQLQRLQMRLAELDASLADPQVTADMGRYRTLAREQAEAAEVVGLFRRYEQRERDLAAARELQADPDMAEMAREEISSAEAELSTLLAELQTALLPRDPDDHRNAFVEIRAGTGGEESALFAADLARMYTRHAERQGWRTEVMSENASDLGGYKEIVFRFEGEDVYAQMKFESGGHRVQRVPETEAQGRIHTSACTVAVMPEPDEAAEVTLNPADLRIDTQHRNKAKALAVLQARLRDRERAEREAKEAATRKALVGTGDRSDRIRTYNFPQGRLTDHRINLTLYKLGQIMDGDLHDVIAALQAEQAQQQLAALESGGAA
jgi:peptide chain release factor 1